MKRGLVYIVIIAMVLILYPTLSAAASEAADVMSQKTAGVDTLIVRGEEAIRQGDLDKASGIFSEICSRDDGHSSRELFSRAYQRRGFIQCCREHYSDAMQSYLKACEIAESNGLADRLSSIYTSIGNVFSETDNLESGIMLYRKALSAVRNKGDIEQFSILYNNMLYAYYLKGDADSVRHYFKLLKKLGASDSRYRYDLSLNRGLLHNVEGENDLAVSLFHIAAGYARDSLRSSECLAAAYSHIAKAYESEDRMDSALRYLRLNESMARENNHNVLLAECLRDIARIYDKTGRSAEAMQYKSEYLSITDSILSRETLYSIKNSQALYEKNRDSTTIRFLNTAIALQRHWIAFLIAVLAVIATLSIILWRQKRTLSRTYHELYDRNLLLLDAEQHLTGRTVTQGKNISECDGEDSAGEDVRARRPLLDDERRENLLVRIRNVMEDPEFYCRPDCSIDRLAAAIDSNARYVSEVINEEYGMNFRAFLNRYRIRESVRRLEDVEHYGHLTIKAIAEGVGYRSQATFITAFTKETGLKPGVFQRIARRNAK